MYDIIVNAIGIILSIGIFVFSRGFAVSKREGVPSAAFVPRIIAVVVLVLAIFNLVRFIIKRAKGEYEAPAKIQHARFLQLMAIIMLLILYALLWNFHIGHFIANTIIIFTPVCWLLSDEREWWKSAIYVVILTIFIYLLFVNLLKVRIW